MKQQEKKAWLGEHQLAKWVKTREDVFNELSDQQLMWCCCGKLATGLHERYCVKFNKRVDDETVKRLEHLLPADKS